MHIDCVELRCRAPLLFCLQWRVQITKGERMLQSYWMFRDVIHEPAVTSLVQNVIFACVIYDTRDLWCDVVVNVHAQTEDKTDDVEDSFCVELEHVLIHIHVKLLLANFHVNVSLIRNESLHEIISDNWMRAVDFGTSKKLMVKTTVFLHRNIHIFAWASSDGKTQIILISYWLIDG